MSVSKRIVGTLAWLVGPYVAVIVVSFLVGLTDRMFNHPVTRYQDSILGFLAGIAIYGGIGAAIWFVISNRKSKEKN